MAHMGKEKNACRMLVEKL